MLVVTYSAYVSYIFFFFNDTATTEIYTLSLHDALPICSTAKGSTTIRRKYTMKIAAATQRQGPRSILRGLKPLPDRKSTRLNSSHSQISYAVFCLKKKKENTGASDSDAPNHCLSHTQAI